MLKAEALATPATEVPAGPVEEIAQAYLRTAYGDAGVALRCAITDALANLLEAECREKNRERLISVGYVRVGLRRMHQ
ncbi:hypothetical protein [Methylobacterium durans]|uniref:Uncharacterized protein n=1 Tax=Methylobacterium durans TaxID=2202825 RepID=A0A2U8WB36_9HYPH|nr:hypothetical protein [Methylobacterium durans]AWN43365.1 hypothetical protein DK389_26215 [Methylobacterium durans]